MAAGDFVKVAAGQLRRASMMLKQEAQGMLNERERTARRVSSQITDYQLQLKAMQGMLNDPRRDSREKQRVSSQVKSLQQAIDAKQREMNRLVQQLADAARVKQLKASGLDNRAGDLEAQVSTL
jgi:predicted RNase H-like nuclease (RuvC/YqgF family)